MEEPVVNLVLGQNEEINKLKSILRAIAALGGNLSDARMSNRTGPNDAKARGLMYCEARRLALVGLYGEGATFEKR